MRKFFFKILFLLLPYFLFVTGAILYAEYRVPFRERIFDDVVQQKLDAFLKKDPDILIGGDSRAERQVIPSIISSHANLEAANIASSGCDFITLYNALKHYGLLSQKRVLIVSISLFQVNDGAIHEGCLSTASLLNIPFSEKVWLYRSDLNSLMLGLIRAFQSNHRLESKTAITHIDEKGFGGVEGVLQLPLSPPHKDHPWYKNFSFGIKWRLFERTLKAFGSSALTVYIYLPPVSPAWMSLTEGSSIDKKQREFGEMLKRAAQPYPNIRILDFYSFPDARLNNKMYTDAVHLNRTGAEIFTQMLLEKIAGTLPRKALKSPPGIGQASNSPDFSKQTQSVPLPLPNVSHHNLLSEN